VLRHVPQAHFETRTCLPGEACVCSPVTPPQPGPSVQLLKLQFPRSQGRPCGWQWRAVLVGVECLKWSRLPSAAAPAVSVRLPGSTVDCGRSRVALPGASPAVRSFRGCRGCLPINRHRRQSAAGCVHSTARCGSNRVFILEDDNRLRRSHWHKRCTGQHREQRQAICWPWDRQRQMRRACRRVVLE